VPESPILAQTTVELPLTEKIGKETTLNEKIENAPVPEQTVQDTNVLLL